MDEGVLAVVETAEGRINVRDARTLRTARSLLNGISEKAKNIPAPKRKKRED